MISPNAEPVFLASGDSEGGVSVHSLHGGEEVHRLEVGAYVTDLAFGVTVDEYYHAHRQLVVATEDGNVQSWKVPSGGLLHGPFDGQRQLGLNPIAVGTTTEQEALLAKSRVEGDSSEGVVDLVDLRTGEYVRTLSMGNELPVSLGIGGEPGKEVVAAGTRSGEVWTWNLPVALGEATTQDIRPWMGPAISRNPSGLRGRITALDVGSRHVFAGDGYNYLSVIPTPNAPDAVEYVVRGGVTYDGGKTILPHPVRGVAVGTYGNTEIVATMRQQEDPVDRALLSVRTAASSEEGGRELMRLTADTLASRTVVVAPILGQAAVIAGFSDGTVRSYSVPDPNSNEFLRAPLEHADSFRYSDRIVRADITALAVG